MGCHSIHANIITDTICVSIEIQLPYSQGILNFAQTLNHRVSQGLQNTSRILCAESKRAAIKSTSWKLLFEAHKPLSHFFFLKEDAFKKLASIISFVTWVLFGIQLPKRVHLHPHHSSVGKEDHVKPCSGSRLYRILYAQ